ARRARDPGYGGHCWGRGLKLGWGGGRGAPRDVPAPAEVLFLVNADDGPVKTPAVLDLARVWNDRGVPVSVYEFPDSLGLPHNIVDPMHRRADAGAVYPTLEALAHGENPPAWLRARH